MGEITHDDFSERLRRLECRQRETAPKDSTSPISAQYRLNQGFIFYENPFKSSGIDFALSLGQALIREAGLSLRIRPLSR
jgi:hypothetical protein